MNWIFVSCFVFCVKKISTKRHHPVFLITFPFSLTLTIQPSSLFAIQWDPLKMSSVIRKSPSLRFRDTRQDRESLMIESGKAEWTRSKKVKLLQILKVSVPIENILFVVSRRKRFRTPGLKERTKVDEPIRL